MIERARNIQKDISDLGTLASKLRDLHQDLDEVGGDSATDRFIMSTKSMGAAELQVRLLMLKIPTISDLIIKGHTFFKLSPGSACLVPRVAIAERQWFRNWTVQKIEAGA